LSIDGTDAGVADPLDAAASQAQRRGAPVAAAQLQELAVIATPTSDVDRLVTRELALARCRLDAGDVAGARVVAARSLDRRPPGPGRVDALLLLSAVEQAGARLPEARQWLTHALAEAGTDRAALARAHVTAGMTAWEDVDTERAHAQAAVRALAGHEEEDPSSAATALVLLAGTDFEAGRGLRVDLLDRAVALEERTDLVTMMRPSTQRAIFLGHAGQIADSLPAIADCVARAARLGDESSLPHLLRTLAWMQLGAGMLREARETIARAMSLAEDLDLADAYIWAVAGQIHAAIGETEVAADLCQRAVDRARDSGNPWAEIRALAATGFGHLSADRSADAAQALTAAAELASSGRLVEIGWHRMHGDLVEALVGCGRLMEAADAARAFQERAEHTGHPWSAAVSRRALAQVAAATGKLEDAIQEFERGLAEPVLAQMPFERARGLLGLGVALRRSNRRKDARAALAEAADLFESMGAKPWLERARAEAGAISGRAGDPEGLTAMQYRVAMLAVAGRTNAEIAQELFLSVRTVESHLAAAYRRLGARSRTELAALLHAVAR
jgi:DNA-binding CsgD family transcriptional regulator